MHGLGAANDEDEAAQLSSRFYTLVPQLGRGERMIIDTLDTLEGKVEQVQLLADAKIAASIPRVSVCSNSEKLEEWTMQRRKWCSCKIGGLLCHCKE